MNSDEFYNDWPNHLGNIGSEIPDWRQRASQMVDHMRSKALAQDRLIIKQERLISELLSGLYIARSVLISLGPVVSRHVLTEINLRIELTKAVSEWSGE